MSNLRCYALLLTLALVPSLGVLKTAQPLSQDRSTSNASVSAAAATIDGYVFSRDSMPLVGALVSTPSVQRQTRTDSTGYFRLDGFRAGEHTVTARVLGFQPVSVQVKTSAEGVVGVRITIGENIQRLRSVRVVAEGLVESSSFSALEDFDRRMRRGVGSFITRRDLENAVTLTPVLAQIPGVRLQTNEFGDRSISFARCQSAVYSEDAAPNIVYFLDGLRVTTNLLTSLTPQNIEAMEIYRGPSQLPLEAVGDACAAVFIWTRRSP